MLGRKSCEASIAPIGLLIHTVISERSRPDVCGLAAAVVWANEEMAVEGFTYQQWGVSRSKKQPLIDFIVTGLQEAGCVLLYVSDASTAPFYVTYETPSGEREGVLIYAFFANSKLTRNRPADEHRFQVKYGSDTKALLPLEQDPARLVTTIFVGIDLEQGILVGADPVLHSGTPMFISIEFKREHVAQVQSRGWHVWERDTRRNAEEPVEILVAVRRNRLLDYIRFERTACGLDQGHRQLLAEKALPVVSIKRAATHALVKELGLPENALFDLIHQTGRLKMAVRGWVAEVHLEEFLQTVHGVDNCKRLNEEGQPDLIVQYKGRTPILVECKNVLRAPNAHGLARVDFQRTRASKSDPCSRYYRVSEFSLLAACLHARTERWDFMFAPTVGLPPHPTCVGRLKSSLSVDAGWYSDAEKALDIASS